MLEVIEKQNHIIQALLAAIFAWGLTSLGAATVFMKKDIGRRGLDSMLGFAAGVMLAASFWSLLAPAIAMSEHLNRLAWVPAAAGFLVGGIFAWSLDKILPHLHLGSPDTQAEGIKTSWRRSTLLFLAMTLHNIPEGLAIGVAFGALAAGGAHASFSAACAVTIGIGIQDFPEGLAVSVPLRGAGMSRLKSFWYGQLSGIVEPIAAVVGAAAVMLVQSLLPYALAFAAGVMIFVVVEGVIPESRRQGNTDLATMGVIIGFVTMMVLEVSLG